MKKYCHQGGPRQFRYTSRANQVHPSGSQWQNSAVIGAKSHQHSTVSCRLVQLWSSRKKENVCAPLVA